MSGLSVLLQPRPLILTGLPYKRNDALREVTRTARVGAEAQLKVTYVATDARYPLPYGADRGLLAWITTKAFSTGQLKFHAVREYFQAFRLDGGGRSYRLFWQRWQRISNLAIRIEEASTDSRQVRRFFLVPSSFEPLSPGVLARGRLRAEADGNLLTYDRYGFELDAGFWQYLRETRVPTSLDLLRRLHDQPQAWDFAQLLLFRCYSAKAPSLIPWDELVEQLGATTTHPRRLKASLAGVLDTCRTVDPEFPARFRAGLAGLEVAPWRMPMS